MQASAQAVGERTKPTSPSGTKELILTPRGIATSQTKLTLDEQT
jgi:hypothetical protein